MLDIHKYFEYNINKVNILKHFRQVSLLFSVLALLTGLLIYLVLRENTYINSLIPEHIGNIVKYCFKAVPQNSFIKYYFADFLWCYALNYALCVVQVSISAKKLIVISIVSFLVGIAFEIMQLFSICIGTFDLIDIGMYFAASLLSVVINIILLKRKGLL